MATGQDYLREIAYKVDSLYTGALLDAADRLDAALLECQRLTDRLAEYKREAQKSSRRESDLKNARDRAEARVKELSDCLAQSTNDLCRLNQTLSHCEKLLSMLGN